MTPRARPGLFVSYSHRDGIWLEKLRPYLGALARERGFDVDFWDDTRIRPGSAWETELMDALQSARVAILLVSPHFLNSGYIGDKELPVILDGAQQSRVTVLPVILSPCRWAHHPVLGTIQSVNPPDQPLQGLSAVKRETVFLRVTELADAALRADGAPSPAQPAPPPRPARPSASAAPAALPASPRRPASQPLPPPRPALQLNDDWADVVIQSMADGSLLFQCIRGNVRLEGRTPRPQPPLLQRLLARCVNGHTSGAMEAAALFELLVPPELKPSLFQAPGVLLALDAVTAQLPWELLHDGPRALGLDCAILRKTIAERFTPHPSCSQACVTVAATANLQQPGFASLPGVEREAQDVAKQFRAAGFSVEHLGDAEPLGLIGHLLVQPTRVLHASGHGVFDAPLREGGPRMTGFPVGDDLVFGPAEVQQMRVAPEVVFLNASDLGRHASPGDTPPGGGPRPAASLPDQFLAIGTRAVLAPAGPVDDAAAVEFARAFYDTLLAGHQLGDAVLAARRAAHAAAPHSSTWGLYLAYGDPEYRLMPAPPAAAAPPAKSARKRRSGA